ncbi:MAG: HTH-type transcriptional regulator CymR [Candidatus Omnitrophica bacterium ADurb.Bin277]|jgi:Rrf2 family protein|nr:MAG: HTH-type transcriptional regulator CymR [Candidatus Omnitrophica bacterium ADurb.Bin277]
MKLTTLSEYGLLALSYLARQEGDECVSLTEIAEEQELPLKYLEHIMQTLCRAGYLVSTRGKKGGYRLNGKASEITLAEIVRLFDGALAPTDSVSKYFYRSTPIEKQKKLLVVMRDIRNYIAKKLESVTLADIA